MEENQRRVQENADWQGSTLNYEELIIEMVQNITNKDYLEKIYYYVRVKYKRDKEKGR